MTPLHSFLKIVNHFKPAVGKPYLNHSPVKGTALSHHIPKSLKAIEQSGHVRHLSNELAGYITTRKPLWTYPLKDRED